jgi:hypothetical protein
MAMNFVTFNQNYGCLAVGALPPHYELIDVELILNLQGPLEAFAYITLTRSPRYLAAMKGMLPLSRCCSRRRWSPLSFPQGTWLFKTQR